MQIRKINRSLIIGLAFMLFCFFATVVTAGGDIGPFIDRIIFILVLVPALAVVLATENLKVLYQGLRAVVLPHEEISEETKGKAASLLRLMSKTVAITVAVIFIMCAINLLMFSYPDGLDYKYTWTDVYVPYLLGANASYALIAPVWGMFYIVAVFEPAIFILKKRYSGKR